MCDGFIPSFPDLSAVIAATAAAGRNSVADKGKGAGKEIDVSDVTRDILAGIEVCCLSKLFCLGCS